MNYTIVKAAYFRGETLVRLVPLPDPQQVIAFAFVDGKRRRIQITLTAGDSPADGPTYYIEGKVTEATQIQLVQ